MDRTLATQGCGNRRGFVSRPRGRSDHSGQGQVGDNHRLWCRRTRDRWNLTPGGIPGGVQKRWLTMEGQSQGAALQTCSARSEFAGIFRLIPNRDRIGQNARENWPALCSPAEILLHGPRAISIRACRGHREIAPRRRGPTGGPGKGEHSPSIVEGQVGAGRPPPPIHAAWAPKGADDLSRGMKVSLTLRLLQSTERHGLCRGGNGSHGEDSGFPRWRPRWTGPLQPKAVGTGEGLCPGLGAVPTTADRAR